MGKRKQQFEEKDSTKKSAGSKPMMRRKTIIPQLQRELKFHDFQILLSGPQTLVAGINSTTPQSLNTIPQGADRINRLGRDVFMKSLHMKVTVDCGAAVTDTSRFRLIVYLDKENVAPAAILAALYKIRAANEIDMNTTRELADSVRLKVLKNELSPTLITQPSVTGVSYPNRFTWDVDIPLNIKCRFAGAATAIPNNNGLYYAVISDNNQAAGTFSPFFTVQSRVMFYDD